MKYKEMMSAVMAKPADYEKKAEAKDLHPVDRKVIACGMDTGRELYYEVEPRKVDPDCGSTVREPDFHTPVIREQTKSRKLEELRQDMKARLKEVKS